MFKRQRSLIWLTPVILILLTSSVAATIPPLSKESSPVSIPAAQAGAVPLAPEIREDSSVGEDEPTFDIFYDEIVPVTYEGGPICLSSQSSHCHPLAIDDAVRIFVNGVLVLDHESFTQDFGPLDFSGLLQLGTNQVQVQLIDLVGPERGGSALWLVPGGEICEPDPLEPDNSAEEATPITPGQQQTHILCPGDVDWVRVEADRQVTYLFQTSSPDNLDTEVFLLDDSSSQIIDVDDNDVKNDDPGVFGNFEFRKDPSGRVVWTATSGQTYYLKVTLAEKAELLTEGVEYIAALQKEGAWVVPDRADEWLPSQVTIPYINRDGDLFFIGQLFQWNSEALDSFKSFGADFQWEFNRSPLVLCNHEYLDYLPGMYKSNLPDNSDRFSEECDDPGIISGIINFFSPRNDEFEVKSGDPSALESDKQYYVLAPFKRDSGEYDNLFLYTIEAERCIHTDALCIFKGVLNKFNPNDDFDYRELITGWTRS